MAEQAAACWLAAYEAHATSLRAVAGLAGRGTVSHYERRRDRAQRRFERSVGSLERVRKLAAPREWPRVNFGGRLAGVVAAGRD
jgi:hypothetical protein